MKGIGLVAALMFPVAAFGQDAGSGADPMTDTAQAPAEARIPLGTVARKPDGHAEGEDPLGVARAIKPLQAKGDVFERQDVATAQAEVEAPEETAAGGEVISSGGGEDMAAEKGADAAAAGTDSILHRRVLDYYYYHDYYY